MSRVSGRSDLFLHALCRFSRMANACTVKKKYPYTHGHFVASFPYLTEPVCIRKSTEKMKPRCVDLRIETYTELVPLKYGKLGTKYRPTWIYGYFLQCGVQG